jgi:hypothetical protein
MNFSHLLNCLFNNEYNLIRIDENLSQVLYHNNDHIGEKIGILALREMLEPNIMNFFSSNKSNKSKL